MSDQLVNDLVYFTDKDGRSMAILGSLVSNLLIYQSLFSDIFFQASLNAYILA